LYGLQKHNQADISAASHEMADKQGHTIIQDSKQKTQDETGRAYAESKQWKGKEGTKRVSRQMNNIMDVV